VWSKFLGWTALALMMALAPGCARIHEPWVQHPDELKMERSRSPELHRVLRLRLAETQRDR
jgi:hypothetical protein